MKALIYEGPSEMNIRDVEAPVPGDDEILIRVAYSGICGSELSGFLGKNSLRKPPLIFGPYRDRCEIEKPYGAASRGYTPREEDLESSSIIAHMFVYRESRTEKQKRTTEHGDSSPT